MATKDRTTLKDEFKNGNLATGERFADLIDSVKVVQEPVADPAASGTSLSFIASIEQDKDGKITATKKNVQVFYAQIQDKPTINGVTLMGDNTPAQLGLATANQVGTLSDKVDKLPSGYYYGKFDSVEDLPEATEKGYAYVASSDPTVFYTYLVSGAGAEWVDSGNKMVNTVDLTTPKTAETELSKGEKYYASANVNDRPADVVIETGVVKALGYKVLDKRKRFAEQVEGVNNANMIFEIKDSFDLEGGSVTIPTNCTLKFNGGKITNGSVLFQNTKIDSDNNVVMEVVPLSGSTIKNDLVNVLWFGYSNDLGAVINKVGSVFKKFKIPEGSYDIATPAKFSNVEHIESYADIRYTGDSTNISVINITESRHATINFYGGITNASGSTDYSDFGRKTSIIGLELNSSNNCHLFVSRIFVFNEGLRISDTKLLGCCYNEIAVNEICNCNVGLRFYQEGSTSWVNENIVTKLKISRTSDWRAIQTTDGTRGTNSLAVVIAGPAWSSYFKGIFSKTNEYSTGERCVYQNKVYEFIEDYVGDWDVSKVKLIDGYDHCNGLKFFGPNTENYKENSPFYLRNCHGVNIDHARGEGGKAFCKFVGKCFHNTLSFGYQDTNNNIDWTDSDAYPLLLNNYALVYSQNTKDIIKKKDSEHDVFFDPIVEGEIWGFMYKAGAENVTINRNTNGDLLPRFAYARHTIGFRIINKGGLVIEPDAPYRFAIVYTQSTTEDLYENKDHVVNYKGPGFVNLGKDLASPPFDRFKYPNNANGRYYFTIATDLQGKCAFFVPSEIKEYYVLIGCGERSTTTPINHINIYSFNENPFKSPNYVKEGTTAQRDGAAKYVGSSFYDKTLGKPIYWNGTAWTDANGETVGLQVSDKSVLIDSAGSTKTISVYYTGDIAPTITVLNSDDTANTWLTGSLSNNTLTLTAAANVVAPAWTADTYYSESGGNYTLLTSEPNNWRTNYADYYTKDKDNKVYSAVVGVANNKPRGAKVLVTLDDEDELVIINVVQSY